MFGRKSKGFVQMYEYGCRNEPVGGLDAALDQMERRVQLWNRFVEIEREIRRRARLLLRSSSRSSNEGGHRTTGTSVERLGPNLCAFSKGTARAHFLYSAWP